MKTSKFVLLVFLLAGFSLPSAQAQSQATAAFEKLKNLAGNWEGKDGDGQPVKTNFKIIVGGTAVMETLTAAGMEEMVTLYSIDGDSLALTHYCPTGNQPHMRATPFKGDVKELVFTFLSAGNLPTPTTGHENKLVTHFEDPTHLNGIWTWRRNGKDPRWSITLFAPLGRPPDPSVARPKAFACRCASPKPKNPRSALAGRTRVALARPVVTSRDVAPAQLTFAARNQVQLRPTIWPAADDSSCFAPHV